MLTFTDRESHSYKIDKAHVNGNDFLMIQKDGAKHFYRVINDYEYTIKIQKTQIKAARGVTGLYEHFEDCISHNFAMDAWVINPINHILNNVKEVKP